MLLGINPGRYGGGLTGIPFTDPVVLSKNCHISNNFRQISELSSCFIYEVIESIGGPEVFYQKHYITGLSPLGYVQNGKNLNYYDIENWQTIFDGIFEKWIEQQLDFGIERHVAYCIGKGENYKQLIKINKDRKYFKKIMPLPHPRWVMQYNLKSKDFFIEQYRQALI